MAVITYEDVIPSLISNTAMQKGFLDGVHKLYCITPSEGYVLHDSFSDFSVFDPNTMEEVHKSGYVGGTISIGANYDFVANPREFYAVPRDSVPADQIFGGGGNNEHEIM